MRRRFSNNTSSRQRSPSFSHAKVKPKAHSSRVSSLIAIMGSVASSVAIVMVNKHVLTSGFPFASTLTALHQLFGFFFANALIFWGVIPSLPAPQPRQHFARLLVAALYASGLVLMNQCLGLNSVSFYQLLKMSSIPTIAILQFLMYGTLLNFATIVSLLLILFGVFVSSTTESHDPNAVPEFSYNHSKPMGDNVRALVVAFYPLMISILAVLTTALGQILLNRSPDLKRLSSLQSIAALSFTSFLVCGMSAIATDVGIYPGDWIRFVLSLTGVSNLLYHILPSGFEWLLFSGEDLDAVMQAARENGVDFHEFLGGVSSKAYLTEHILGKFVSFMTKAAAPSAPLGWVFISCLLSVLANLFGFAVIKETGPITYQVVGHFKTVLTLVVGAVLFGSEGLLGGRGVGLIIALVGMFLYTRFIENY